MPQPNDLSRSLVALDQDSTIIAVVEMSQSSWLVAGVLPGIERQPRKKLEPNAERLLGLLHRWRDEAVRAGKKITRIALAFEAGRVRPAYARPGEPGPLMNKRSSRSRRYRSRLNRARSSPHRLPVVACEVASGSSRCCVPNSVSIYVKKLKGRLCANPIPSGPDLRPASR